MRWSAICISVALLVVVVLRASLPTALEVVLPELALRQAGVRLEVDDIDLSLIAGELSASGIRIGLAEPAEAPGGASTAEAILELERLHLELDWRALATRSLHLRTIDLESPRVRLRQRADGSILVPGLADADVKPPASPPVPAADETTAWRYRVDRLNLVGLGGTLRLLEDDASAENVVDFTLKTLSLDGVSIDEDGVDLGDIAIDDPELFVRRSWLEAFLEPADVDDESQPSSPSTTPIRVRKLDVEAARFALRTPLGPFEFATRLVASDVGVAPGHAFPIEVSLRGAEGNVDLRLELILDPLQFEGSVAWRDLSVPLFLILGNPDFIPWLRSCRSSGELDLALETADDERGPSVLTARGKASVSDFALEDPENGELGLRWERLDIALRRVSIPLDPMSPHPRRVELDRIEFTRPFVVLTRPPEAIDRLLVTLGGAVDAPEEMREERDDAPVDEEEQTAANPGTEAPPPVAFVEKLVVKDGGARLVDETVTPVHETEIEDLEVTVAGLRLPGGDVEALDVAGAVQRSGRFSIVGSYAPGAADLAIDVKRLDLTSYDAFAREAGWSISSGWGSVQSKVELDGDVYKTRNDVVLHDIDVRSDDEGQFQSTFGVPLDLAIALLREPSGDIDLSVPVEGRREAVELDLRSVLFDALQEAITGALATPLKLVGMIKPGRDADASLRPIPTEPGSIEIRKKDEKRLGKLASLVKEKPGVRLTLEGTTAPVDHPALALRALRKRLEAGDGLPDVEGIGLLARRRIRSAIRDDRLDALSPDDLALLDRVLAAQPVSDEAYEALARARAERVRELMIGAGASEAAIEVGRPGKRSVPGVVLHLEAAEV